MEFEVGGNENATAESDIIANRLDRALVGLRIQNETSDVGDGATDAYVYQPSDVVTRMHHAPRGIGNTNQISSLLAETPTGENDYVGGLKLFAGFFIITPFVLWILLLVALKLKNICANRAGGKHSTGKVETPKTQASQDAKAATPSPKPKRKTAERQIPSTSWIAGGDVIDMYALSRAGVSRKERKRLVVRSWKIQSTFLSVSILIPVLSVVLLEFGWKPLETAMLEIQDLSGEVEDLAYRGLAAVERLELSKDEMFAENELVRLILEYSYASGVERNQKPYIEEQDNRDHDRRAQWFQEATSTPTFPVTSDFDSEFFMPWHEITSPPLGQQTATGEVINKNEDVSNIDAFENNGGGISVEGNIDSPTPVDAFFNTSSPSQGIFIDDWCPDAIRFIGTEELNYWTDSINSLTERTHTIHQIFSSLEVSFPSMQSQSPSRDDTNSTQKPFAFQFVTETTNYVDESIEWFLANDWLLKLLILVLNVVNGLLLANVYFFSKNNVIHQPTRLYTTYILVPLFVFAAVSIVAVTVAAGVAVLINADFCSGADGPQGTVEEAISTLQERQEMNGMAPNEALGLVHDAVDYYWTGCLSENPLQFLEDFSDEIDDAAAKVNQFTVLFPLDGSNPTANGMLTQETETDFSGSESPRGISLSVLEKACQRDMSFLSPSVHDLKRQVDQIRTSIHRVSNTFSCGQVSPLLRKISHGPVCVESPQGLAVLWGTSFGISVLCFIMLTVRAALYNSVKYKKRRPTKPRRIVEKEFDEYKEFMGKFYGEETTKQWKIDGIPLPPTKLEIEFDDDIELKGTFDTAKSSKDSDGGSENAGIYVRKMDGDQSSYGSSYDSECSDDEKSIDSDNGDDLSSAIGSLLSETKSIAMQTIHSLRNVKSLLSTSKKTKNPPAHVGNPNVQLGNLDESDDDIGNDVFFARQVDTFSDLGVDDGNSGANSISDASLYLPTPTSRSGKSTSADPPAKNFGKKSALALSINDDFSDEDDVNDERDKYFVSKKSWTPTNTIIPSSPSAPRKPASFLARTLYAGKEDVGDYTEEELNSLVKPKQLANLNSFRSAARSKSTTRRRGKSRETTGRDKHTTTSSNRR